MGFFLEKAGQQNPVNLTALKKEMNIPLGDKVGFRIEGDPRNPRIIVMRKGRKVKERKPKEFKKPKRDVKPRGRIR